VQRDCQHECGFRSFINSFLRFLISVMFVGKELTRLFEEKEDKVGSMER
jgi:hypothetical protein